MNSNAATVHAPNSGPSGDVGESSAITPEVVSNVTAFPVAKDRIQDIVLRLALEGTLPKDIARIVGLKELQVNKYLTSQWADAEMARMAQEDKLNPTDSIRKLVRIHAFSAVTAIATIVMDTKVNAATRLNAARTILQYSISAATEKDIGRTSEKAQTLVEESSALVAAQARLEKRLSQPI